MAWKGLPHLIHPDYRPEQTFTGALETPHVRWGNADVDPEQMNSASLSLPSLDFLPRAGDDARHGAVAADVQVTGEFGFDDGVRMRTLGVRALAPSLAAMRITPHIRPTSRGFVEAVRITEETVNAPVVRALPAIRNVFGVAGIQVDFQEAGRRAELLIKRMGGAGENSLANQPSYREVLRKAINGRALVGIRHPRASP